MIYQTFDVVAFCLLPHCELTRWRWFWLFSPSAVYWCFTKQRFEKLPGRATITPLCCTSLTRFFCVWNLPWSRRKIKFKCMCLLWLTFSFSLFLFGTFQFFGTCWLFQTKPGTFGYKFLGDFIATFGGFPPFQVAQWLGVSTPFPETFRFRRRQFRLGHRSDLCRNVTLQKALMLGVWCVF